MITRHTLRVTEAARTLSAFVAGLFPAEGYSARDRHADFRRVFLDQPAGRRVLSQILVRCQVWERTYVTGNTHETAHREGMRDVGLWLMEILEREPFEIDGADDGEEIMGERRVHKER